MKRRELLKISVAGVMAGSTSWIAKGDEPKGNRTCKTYVYKETAGCQIKADVYGRTSGTRKPAVLMIHGGALILGQRDRIRKEFFHPLLDKGFVVVSIDYRLAPETKLPEIIEDVQDAYKWVRERGPALFGADPDRIGVQGGSAGGYLTLMTGFCVKPRPKALVSYYGYGDIIGDWYSKPDPFYCKRPRVSKAKAYASVGKKIITQPPEGRSRHFFYLYCRQNGLWPREVAGFDPAVESEAFRPYCPIRNVTADYPPTLFSHGTMDTDVPYEQSVQMACALARAGVAHEFIPLQNAGHGFKNANKQSVRNALDRAAAFLLHYVGQPNILAGK